MKKHMPKWLISTLLLFVSSIAVATTYVDNIPLTKVVSGQVGTVRGSDTIDVPMISWGGDIATILANGNASITKSGSIFADLGLKLRLVREDVFSNQVRNYLSGKSPYLRGTVGMINQASDVLNADARTKPVIIYQMTWSVGGDALVVKNDIRTAKDLKGKTIALQAYGPHTDYLIRTLTDASLSLSDINIKWLKDLTGTDQSPMDALYNNNVDAAFVIIPDALALTSGGNIGTGSEDSIKGAKILLSTKTASRVIADVYAVRADYLKSNKADVEKFVRGLMQGEEALSSLVRNKAKQAGKYQQTISAAAEQLLDSAAATADIEGMYIDAEFVGFDGNVKSFTDSRYPRRISVLSEEAQAGLKQLGLVKGDTPIGVAGWDYGFLKTGLSSVGQKSTPRFDEQRVANVVSQRQQLGSLQEGELFSFEVFFKPNQRSFSADLYQDAFNKVIDLASTYAGAIITVEGHSDPMGYLRKKKSGSADIILGRIKQSARNLSISRAQEVRDNIIAYSESLGVYLDPTQFAVVGHGISMPKSGICGSDPCAPKSEQDWRSNMRVVFRIIQVEAEESVFSPL